VGTNTVGDQVVVPNGNLPVTKHDMISYQVSDGKVNNHLPTVNGKFLTRKYFVSSTNRPAIYIHMQKYLHIIALLLLQHDSQKRLDGGLFILKLFFRILQIFVTLILFLVAFSGSKP